MRTLRSLLFLFFLAALPAAHLQQAAYAQQAYMLPKGLLEGRLLNRTDPFIAPSGVQLELIELGRGMNVIRVETTDAGGAFRIGGLPENRRLMIQADYKGIHYHSMVSFDEEGRAQVEIDVFEPTASMKDIEIEATQIAFQFTGEHLKSLETVAIHNRTDPPKSFLSPEGTFRVSKAPGILEPPEMRISAPGSSMPLIQSALESADGQSYYILYPLKPGTTSIEVQQLLPYSGRSYTFAKKFYQDAGSVDIGVIPRDMQLAGKDLAKIQTDSAGNFAVYRSAPIKAGTLVAWTFSGGTPVPETEAAEPAGESGVTAVPGAVGRNALILGPLILLGFILVLWYAYNRSGAAKKAKAGRVRQLKDRREQLLNSIAELDHRHETHDIEQQEFEQRRAEYMRRLLIVTLLLKKP
jgi:hypothetical protein